MDWTTVLWLAPYSAAGWFVGWAVLAYRRRGEWGHLLLLAALLAAVWTAALAPYCVVEGFEGPWSTVDGKLPVECRAEYAEVG